MLFVTDAVSNNTHVEELLLMLISMGKYVHINTGTHGEKDGSTIFWISQKTTDNYERSNAWEKYYEDAQKFIN